MMTAHHAIVELTETGRALRAGVQRMSADLRPDAASRVVLSPQGIQPQSAPSARRLGVVWAGGLGVWPSLLQRFQVTPNELVAERPYIAGGFVWTGFDYRGEPSPYTWPNISSQYGIIDTCGFPKDSFYYYQAWWSGRPPAAGP